MIITPEPPTPPHVKKCDIYHTFFFYFDGFPKSVIYFLKIYTSQTNKWMTARLLDTRKQRWTLLCRETPRKKISNQKQIPGFPLYSVENNVDNFCNLYRLVVCNRTGTYYYHWSIWSFFKFSNKFNIIYYTIWSKKLQMIS